ncbi:MULTISPECIES: hypothetical protein [Rhodococcus]|uniref:Uncharacterized protein n=1 Tax=Rhodococcus oxybenzonivorans TaxID=1990687 RepID=A0AAE4V345_9NOCA|nr:MULTISPECIES: hypothetical protein [Rhodococcus]MDV7240692.1 hypothetical protein [Rhodococcus oxybenzonivorans]MDV7267733.1 hypothetical protein [Rhodococcus oxybenzonivorans]MDV7272965.1 hypothetical protein [Rhodococcus oxybenzonivorans]MDV7333296.1 hypothetical protein [Rhodococcus oxybenzonivorans]MDV7342463.1 hypothetical protein [Rhodococcus oxybenzonivorans]
MRNAIDVAHDLSQIAEPFLDAGARSRVDEFLDMGEGRIAVETILRAAVAGMFTIPRPLLHEVTSCFLVGTSSEQGGEDLRSLVDAALRHNRGVVTDRVATDRVTTEASSRVHCELRPG